MNKKKIIIPWKRFQKPLLLILAGGLLMTVGKCFPAQKEIGHSAGGENGTEQPPGSANGAESVQTLEQELEQLICAISGVKGATVVITYANSGVQTVEKDTEGQSDKTQEQDGAGGTRVTENQQQKEETVYVEDAQGNKYPFVKTETYGTVRGVAVVIKGTYDNSIREKIVRTLEVLLDVPTHKVQVIW